MIDQDLDIEQADIEEQPETDLDTTEPAEAPDQYNPNGGPRTQQGREISSKNATKHGCCAESTLILPDEKLEDFKAIEASYFQTFQPKDAVEKRLVNQVVLADWLLERANRTLVTVESGIHQCGYMAKHWHDENHLRLNRFTRYQAARANAFAKAKKALEDHRKNRLAEFEKACRYAITQERLRAAKKKNNKKELNWKEQLELMTKTARELGYTPPTEDEL